MYVGISNINKEYEVLIKYYKELCTTIRDANDIAPYCVAKRIISPQAYLEMHDIKNQCYQVVMLLGHITGPVKAGSPKGFYDLLDIMELHGLQATQQLAAEIKRSLNIESCYIQSFVSLDVVSVIVKSV